MSCEFWSYVLWRQTPAQTSREKLAASSVTERALYYSIISTAWTFELFATSLTSEFELVTINSGIGKIEILFTVNTRNLMRSNCNFAFCKFCKVLCIDLESKLFNWENDCRNLNSVIMKLIQINSNAVSKIRRWSEKLKKQTNCI